MSFFHALPTDPSLTCSSVLAAVETVESWMLAEYVLEIQLYKRQDLEHRHPNDDDYRRGCVQYYLDTSPCASWEHIAGHLLFWEEGTALDKLKRHLQPKQGTQL